MKLETNSSKTRKSAESTLPVQVPWGVSWRKKLGGELRTGYWARRLFERLSARQIDRLFDAIEAGGISEALLRAPELSFDWHGHAIMSLLKYRMVAGVLNIVRPPFTRSRKD